MSLLLKHASSAKPVFRNVSTVVITCDGAGRGCDAMTAYRFKLEYLDSSQKKRKRKRRMSYDCVRETDKNCSKSL